MESAHFDIVILERRLLLLGFGIKTWANLFTFRMLRSGWQLSRAEKNLVR
jgi:hypothetical protein